MTNRRNTGGVRVHRVAELEVHVARALPCTGLPRTLLDSRRDAWLIGHGRRPVRFTWFDVVHDPAYVLETLRAMR